MGSVLVEFKLGNYKTVLTYSSHFNRIIQDRVVAIFNKDR